MYALKGSMISLLGEFFVFSFSFSLVLFLVFPSDKYSFHYRILSLSLYRDERAFVPRVGLLYDRPR